VRKRGNGIKRGKGEKEGKGDKEGERRVKGIKRGEDGKRQVRRSNGEILFCFSLYTCILLLPVFEIKKNELCTSSETMYIGTDFSDES